MNKSVVNYIEKYSSLSILDYHYLALKFYGVKDRRHFLGRPTFNLISNSSMYHITFGSSEEASPYSIIDQSIYYNNEPLPFRVDFVERMPILNGRYYYYRHTDYLTPTLLNKKTLNLNFKRECFQCDFCQFKLYEHMEDIDIDQGFKNLDKNINPNFSFEKLDEIAIVTGCFGNRFEAKNHILKIIDMAYDRGFTGQIMYMGYEAANIEDTEEIIDKILKCNMLGYRLIFTIECFDRGRLMNGAKGKLEFNKIVSSFKKLSKLPLTSLEYSYIPCLDSLDDFLQKSYIVRDYAIPHLCIFRPWRQNQLKEQMHLDAQKQGLQYLFKMKEHFENIYDGPILGNNLGNMWPFPLSKIDQRWVSTEIVGDRENERFWINDTDPRLMMKKNNYGGYGCYEKDNWT